MIRLTVAGAAVWTPAGDLDATIAAIAAAGGVAPPTAPTVDARSRTARLLGALPATAVEVARTAARALPAGDRTGVFLAAGGLRAHWDELAPAMTGQSDDATASWARGLKRLHPLWMLRYLSNGAQAAIAHDLGLIGDGATFAGAAAAASAIASAAAAIDAGAIDHAVIVALDDLTAIEAAVELVARHPGVTPSLAVAAIAVTGQPELTKVTASASKCAILIAAVDGIDPEAGEPGVAAIAAVRARLPEADRDVAFAARLGAFGAAAPLIDVAIVAHWLTRKTTELEGMRAVTCTASGAPGQIGVIRVERASEQGERHGS